MDLPSGWHLWVLAAIASGALELKLGNFVFVWFALGSAVLAALGLPAEAQVIAFTLSASALFLASRTIFKRLLMRGADRIKTGAELMLGKEAVVTEAVSDRAGAVRIHGELWTARCLEAPIALGEPVRVERVEGLTLFVRRPTVALWDSNQKEAKP
jgi:membrane protein implicated in regulation of membrane protease activity